MANPWGRRVPHVVIVGAGFGGLCAARALAHAPVRITVVDRNNFHLFQPLLYQVATADLSVEDISAPIRRVLRRQRHTEMLMGEAVGVDPAGRRVHVRDRFGPHDLSLDYDYLVLATGAEQSYFGHPEWERLAPGLKSAPSALAIRDKILAAFEEAELEQDPERRRALLTFVLVGGGPTGVEMAGAIAEMAHRSLARDFRHIDARSARVVLVEGEPQILPSFRQPLARSARRHLERLGVEVRTPARVEQVDEEGVVIGDERLAARTVIWCAGVRASPAGRWLGAREDHAGHVLVRGDLSLPDHPEIFAIGDTAALADRGEPLPGVAPVAIQQGEHVARAIRRRLAGRPTRPFRYRDKGSLAVIGRGFAVADLPRDVGFDGFFAWLIWLFVHLIYLVGFRNRLAVLLQLAWYYLTSQAGARVIVLRDGGAPTGRAVGQTAGANPAADALSPGVAPDDRQGSAPPREPGRREAVGSAPEA